MSSLVYGCTLVLPSPTFDPVATVYALESEKCTGIHGVPTVFGAILQSYRQRGIRPPYLRTGTIGGSQVSPTMLTELRQAFGLKDLGTAYGEFTYTRIYLSSSNLIIAGMTETSPLSYLSSGLQQDKTVTWMEIMPHTQAKIIDSQGNTVPLGCSGELCIAGYLLQQGYYKNPEKTGEVMRVHQDDGLLWMHTGDEAIMNEQGHCRISGRIKDIIIRGGENVYPAEIEDRLNMHPAIAMSAVVGVPDARYGEVVGAFLQLTHGESPLPVQGVQNWVQETLGKHKAPQFVFYLGVDGVPNDFPKTASGKIKKVDLVARVTHLVRRTSKL
jgi:acyl-CoA synthetase (AMP-forming)/AMP-acid ligase II